MIKTELMLEAVTPIILHGSDPRGEPELRAPSFRGVFRYWFRAIAGAVIGDSKIPLLIDLESSVFGGTESGSPIKLKIPQSSANETIGKVYILPHHHQGIRSAYMKGKKIPLHISATGINQDSWVWRTTVASINLALTFGGIGLRSRRGYGTLRIVENTDHYFAPFPETMDQWQKHILNVISIAFTEFQSLSTASLPISKTITLHS